MQQPEFRTVQPDAENRAAAVGILYRQAADRRGAVEFSIGRLQHLRSGILAVAGIAIIVEVMNGADGAVERHRVKRTGAIVPAVFRRAIEIAIARLDQSGLGLATGIEMTELQQRLEGGAI